MGWNDDGAQATSTQTNTHESHTLYLRTPLDKSLINSSGGGVDTKIFNDGGALFGCGCRLKRG